MRTILTLFATSFVLALGSGQTHAVNLLSNGSFGTLATSPPGWALQEFATGSGTILNTAEQSLFDPQSGARDLWLRAFAGGSTPGPDNLTNAILSQTVPAVAGEDYTFSGYSRWETNYSGGVITLNAASPLGAVASPTSTTMELAFLDSGGGVIGTPVSLDLRTEQSNLDLWAQHTLMDTAPVGTAHARVTAEARDMVWNFEPFGSAFYDNFSLTGAGAPATELLTNADLEELLPTAAGWTVTVDPINDEIVRLPGFADRMLSDSSSGVWMSAFLGAHPNFEADPVDATLSQTVPAVAGGSYTFKGWSRFEENYSGGVDTISLASTGFLAGEASPTQTLMELAFLDGSGAVIGTPITLDLRTEQLNDNTWRQHTLQGIGPAGTASVRVSAAMIDGVFNVDPGQSAFFDDFSLTFVPEPSTVLLAGVALAVIACRRHFTP